MGGLQAGIAFGDAKAFRIGEKVTPKVRIRNVGQAPVAYSYFYARFRFATPRVADPLGRRVPVTDPPHFFSFPASKDDTLKAGDSIDFGGATLELAPTEEHYHHAIRVEPGKYTLGFDGFVKSHPKLGTGTAEFEVKPAAAPPAFDVAAATAPAAPAGVRPGVSVHLSKSPPWPGHSRCAFLDDDRILVHAGPGSGDANTVHRGLQVRSAKDGTLLKSVTVPGHLVGEFRVSADRKWVAAATTADTTGTFVIPAPGVTVWDAATWTVRGRVAGHALLALASDGRTVLVREDDGWGAQGGRVEVWDVVAGKRLRAAPFEFQGIDAGALSPDGSLAVVSGLNEVAYWKWRDGDAHDRVRVGRRVSDLAFSPDGKHVAEGPGPRLTVEVRDAATLKVARTLSDPAQPRVSLLTAGLTFADGGKALVLGNGIGLIPSIPVPHRIHVWDVRTGALLRQIDTEGGAPYSLDVSPDGNTLAATTADDGVSLRTWGLGKADGPAPR